MKKWIVKNTRGYRHSAYLDKITPIQNYFQYVELSFLFRMVEYSRGSHRKQGQVVFTP